MVALMPETLFSTLSGSVGLANFVRTIIFHRVTSLARLKTANDGLTIDAEPRDRIQ